MKVFSSILYSKNKTDCHFSGKCKFSHELKIFYLNCEEWKVFVEWLCTIILRNEKDYISNAKLRTFQIKLEWKISKFSDISVKKIRLKCFCAKNVFKTFTFRCVLPNKLWIATNFTLNQRKIKCNQINFIGFCLFFLYMMLWCVSTKNRDSEKFMSVVFMTFYYSQFEQVI